VAADGPARLGSLAGGGPGAPGVSAWGMPQRTGAGHRLSIVLALAAVCTAAGCSTSTKRAAVNPTPTSSVAASTAAVTSASAPATLPATDSATAAAVSAAVSSPTLLASSALSAPPLSPKAIIPTRSPSPSASVPSAHAVLPTASAKPTPAPPAPTITPVAGQPLAGKVVVLDPGHNLNNSSSINKTVYAGNGVYKACDTTGTSTDAGYPEHAFTWDVANRAAAILRAEGATVILTRPNDSSIGPCITTRAQIGNDAHANAFIAIHADGGPAGGHGFFVMQPPPNNPNVNPGGAAQSRILASVMHDTFHSVTGYPYSTYITNGYYPDTTITGTINLSHGPVITIECLNMRNSGDAAIAANPTDRQRIAAGIAAGLTAFLTR
jgi:N-acetylmuramoyl-L-alanine amidase